MTIFFDFDPATYGPGIPLDSLGFTDYPARNSGGTNGVPIATDPNWVTDNSARNAKYTIGSYNYLGPRTLHDNGGPLVRVETTLRGPTTDIPGSFLDGLVIAKDDLNFIRVRRYGNFSEGSQGLVFDGCINGLQNQVIWPAYTGIQPQRYIGEPLAMTFRFTENRMFLDIDGVEQPLNGATSNYLDVPTWLQMPSMVGYYDYFNTYSYPLFRIRDNNDVISIGKRDTIRATSSTSKLIVPVTCNISGSTNVTVTIRNAANEVVAGPTSAALLSGAATLTIGPIPKIAEQTLLRISANNVGGASQITTVNQLMPETTDLQPVAIGNNDDIPYLGAFCPWNDISRHSVWRIGGHPSYEYIMHPDQDRDIWNVAGVFNNEAPAGFCDFDRNGNPKKFPDDTAYSLSVQLTYSAESGNYIFDMSEAPDLIFTLTGSSSAWWNFIRNFYGLNRHKLTISTIFKTKFQSTGEPYFFMNLTRNANKPNYGMPSTPWRFRIIREDVDPTQTWSPEYLKFCGGLGLNYQRYMQATLNIEPSPGLPAQIITADANLQSNDQSFYRRRLPCHSAESLCELHNYLGWNLWYNVSRLLSDDAITDIFTKFRDNLNPSLRIIVAASNEIWNTSGGYINAYLGYSSSGTARGLGLAMNITGSVPVNGTVLTVSTAGRTKLLPGHKLVAGSTRIGNVITAQLTSSEPEGTLGGKGTYQLTAGVQFGISGTLRIDLAIAGADNGTFPAGYPSWIAATSYSAGDRRSYNGITYECTLAVNSTSAPSSDTSHWTMFADNNLAKQRSYVEDMFRIRSLLVDVFGSLEAMNARVDLVAEGWDVVPFSADVVPYMTWGDGTLRGMDVFKAFSTGTYLTRTALDWTAMTPDEKSYIISNSGVQRREFWRDKILSDLQLKWRNYRQHKIDLVSYLRMLGGNGNEVELWSYEGGNHLIINLAGAITAGTDGASLIGDIVTFHRDYWQDIYQQYYTMMASQVGGHLSHFSTIFPYFQNTPAYSNNFTTFALSGYTEDTETSSKYRGLRSVALAQGGAVVLPPGFEAPRRRLQPTVYRMIVRDLVK